MENDVPENNQNTPGVEPVLEAKAASMVVVLAKNASAVRATVNFLERRGFLARIVPSLNEAIELFTRKEANKLLLSANFPHPKVEMLPVLMHQSFQIETILFAEDSDRKTQSRLSNAKTKHVLFGPVSGPVVMMKIRQIDSALNGDDEANSGSGSSRTSSGKDDESDIKVGGRRTKDGDTVVLNGRASLDSKAALDSLLKTLNSEESEDLNTTPDLERSGDTILQKGRRSKMKEESQDGVDGDGAPISQRAQNLRHGLDLGLTEAPAGASRRRLINPTQFKKPRTGLDESAVDTNDDGSAALAAEQDDARQQAQEMAAAGVAAAQRAPSDAVDKTTKDRSAGANNLAALSETLNPRLPQQKEAPPWADLSSTERAALTDEDKVKQCLREALAIVAGAPTDEIHQINLHKNAALVSLRSQSLTCAFIMSLTYSEQLAPELFHRLSIAFFSLLRDYGFEFENHETYSILLDEKSIVKRAFDSSDYVAITSNQEIEMGVAKVYVSNPVAVTEPYEENMLSVNVREIPVDEPVPFNLFVHLKRNQKYLRYLKQGSSLSSPQADRLESRAVRVLVETQEAEAFRRHYAAHAIQAAPSKKRAS